MKAWWMCSFICISITWMSAPTKLTTTSPRLLFALTLSAEILPFISKIRLAKSTLFSILIFLILCAIHTQMIRFDMAFAAEVVAAFRASDSTLRHVLSCCLRNLLPIIFLHHEDITFDYFNHVTALALDHVLLIVQETHQLLLLQLIVFLFIIVISKLDFHFK